MGKRYFFGAGVDQILAQESANGSVLWALSDQLGTLKDWVNNSGSVLNHVVYGSFGQVVSQSNAAFGSRYGFTGREFDAETGLSYYRSRYYDAGVGRFIGEDSVGFDGGDANLYRYVKNSPIDSTDPSGLITFIIPGADGYGRLVSNVASKAQNGPVFPIGKNPLGSPALAVGLASTFLKEGERIYLLAHSAGNQDTLPGVILALRSFLNDPKNQDKNCPTPQTFFGGIYVGRLDPTAVPKFPFTIGASKVVDVGSNKFPSSDPRDIASKLWPFFDFRADEGVGHNDLLDDVRVLDRLKQQYDFNF